MSQNKYRYVALQVTCQGYENIEYIAFPNLLADDEIKTRCRTRALADLENTYGSSKGFEEYVKQCKCSVTHVTEKAWQDNCGYIW